MEVNPPIGVGSGKAILEVALNGAAYTCELCADLMVPAGMELHLKIEVPV